MHVGLPEPNARGEIIEDTLDILASTWPSIGKVSEPALKLLISDTEGLDGRGIRKGVLHALTLSPELAEDPGKLTEADLQSAFSEIREGMNNE